MGAGPELISRANAIEQDLPYYIDVSPAYVHEVCQSPEEGELVGTNVSLTFAETDELFLGSRVERSLFSFEWSYRRAIKKEVRDGLRQLGSFTAAHARAEELILPAAGVSPDDLRQ